MELVKFEAYNNTTADQSMPAYNKFLFSVHDVVNKSILIYGV